MSIRKTESQDDTQASDLKAWTNINPLTEAANAPGGVESVGGICSTLMEKSRRQLQHTGLEPRRVVALNCCFIRHFSVFGVVFVFNVFGIVFSVFGMHCLRQ